MRTFTKSFLSGLVGLTLLAGSAVTTLAETTSNTTIGFTITDTAPISVTVTADPFSPITYNDVQNGGWVSSGGLDFVVRDPRYAKGDWAVTVSTSGFSSTSSPTSTINASLGLGSLSTSPTGVTSSNITNLATSQTPAQLFAANSSLTEKEVRMNYQATVVVPAKTAPGTYTATVYVNLTSNQD